MFFIVQYSHLGQEYRPYRKISKNKTKKYVSNVDTPAVTLLRLMPQ